MFISYITTYSQTLSVTCLFLTWEESSHIWCIIWYHSESEYRGKKNVRILAKLANLESGKTKQSAEKKTSITNPSKYVCTYKIAHYDEKGSASLTKEWFPQHKDIVAVYRYHTKHVFTTFLREKFWIQYKLKTVRKIFFTLLYQRK